MRGPFGALLWSGTGLGTNRTANTGCAAQVLIKASKWKEIFTLLKLSGVDSNFLLVSISFFMPSLPFFPVSSQPHDMCAAALLDLLFCMWMREQLLMLWWCMQSTAARFFIPAYGGFLWLLLGSLLGTARVLEWAGDTVKIMGCLGTQGLANVLNVLTRSWCG